MDNKGSLSSKCIKLLCISKNHYINSDIRSIIYQAVFYMNKEKESDVIKHVLNEELIYMLDYSLNNRGKIFKVFNYFYYNKLIKEYRKLIDHCKKLLSNNFIITDTKEIKNYLGGLIK